MNATLANTAFGMMIIYLGLRIFAAILDLWQRRKTFLMLTKAMTVTDEMADLHSAHVAKHLEEMKN